MALPFDPLGDNQGPYPRFPRPSTPYPKSQIDPRFVGRGIAVTAPEAGRSLPIVYGTAKVQGTIIEQYSASVMAGPLKAPSWRINAPYSIGDRVTANGNTYVATKAGVSAGSGTGPSGTGTGITDGNTAGGFSGGDDLSVHWDFVEVGTDLIWRPSTVYTVNLLTTRVLANGNFYLLTQSGTSAATGIGPSGTGTGITDNTCVWSYVPAGWRTQLAAAFCEGQIFGAKAVWTDGISTLADYRSVPNEGIFLALGTSSGGLRPATFPIADNVFGDLYSNVAVLFINSLTFSDRKTVNIALEVMSGTGVTDTVPDENPADIVIEMLTDARKGAGWLTARVDTTGTLGAGVASSYRNYCKANGLMLSWVIDTQAPTIDLLGLLLSATNSDAVWTGGMLKFFPRSDQAITANGATYTPNLTPAYNLTQDDIVGLVEVTSRRSGQQSFNDYPIEYTDRALGYVRNTVDDPDMADVDKRGQLRAATVALPQVISPAAAIMLSRIYAQRSLKVRNTYKFRLPHRFMLLDPCDIVTLTDSISGLSAVPVRITAIEEDQALDGQFLVEAEDFPAAVHAAAQYTPQAGDGFKPNRGTATQQAPVIPINQPQASTADSTSTRGGSVHNMWPNPTSEGSPPDGSNLITAEWAGRVNAGAGAFAGNWVREVSAAHGVTGVRQGDGIPTTAADAAIGTTASAIFFKVKCSPRETFVMEAQIRGTAFPVGGTNSVLLGAFFMDANDVFVASALLSDATFMTGSTPTAYNFKSITSTAVSASTASVVFVLGVDPQTANAGTITAQFDAITIYKKIEASADAAQVGTVLNVAAGGNAFNDIPGTSQSFTPNTASRKIKVTLVFSASSAGAAGNSEVRIVFGGTPTQAGSTYKLAWNTMAQHQSWAFMWVLPAATLGPVGTAVTVKAQVRSPTGSAAQFNMDANDTSAMVVEEIG